jgi:uncharacterized membrane protein (DUF4010 family)
VNHWNVIVALGIGLLIGLERERRKGRGPTRAAAGVRTFAFVGLLGALAAEFGTAAVVVCVAFIALAAIGAYITRPDDDPGLTTEVILVTTFLLGALTKTDAVLAAGLAVIVTGLLAGRSQIHHLVRDSLSPQEVHDGLVFAAAALVVLPLVPNRSLGPFGVFNPFLIWRLVVLVMAISAAGYIALRLLGPRRGLLITGLFGGLISSTATIGAMGAHVRRDAQMIRPAVAGGFLATATSLGELAVIVGATSPVALPAVAVPVILAGCAAAGFSAVVVLRTDRTEPDRKAPRGRAFDLRFAILFAMTVTAVTLLAAALRSRFGLPGLAVGAGVAGLVDMQAGGISIAGLVAAGKLAPDQAVIPILVVMSANSVSKAVLAVIAGGWAYATRVWLGLILVTAVAWAAAAVALAS